MSLPFPSPFIILIPKRTLDSRAGPRAAVRFCYIAFIEMQAAYRHRILLLSQRQTRSDSTVSSMKAKKSYFTFTISLNINLTSRLNINSTCAYRYFMFPHFHVVAFNAIWNNFFNFLPVYFYPDLVIVCAARKIYFYFWF